MISFKQYCLRVFVRELGREKLGIVGGSWMLNMHIITTDGKH